MFPYRDRSFSSFLFAFRGEFFWGFPQAACTSVTDVVWKLAASRGRDLFVSTDKRQRRCLSSVWIETDTLEDERAREKKRGGGGGQGTAGGGGCGRADWILFFSRVTCGEEERKTSFLRETDTRSWRGRARREEEDVRRTTERLLQFLCTFCVCLARGCL